MSKKLICMAALAALGGAAHAQDLYVGLGLPNKFTLGYAHPFSEKWGGRIEYAGGTSTNIDGTDNGVTYTGKFTSSRGGMFADWYAFGGGFRFVGGVTANDTKFEINALGSGTATINNTTVNMSGHYYNLTVKYAPVTPYLGIGYGHQISTKGLGFYFDVGATYGTFTADVTTDLVSAGLVTQADVDAQKQKMNDSLGSYKWMPSFSVGMVYRF